MEKILKTIEGIFDGKDMVTEDGSKIAVPHNYASKSMLLSGAKLKYYITNSRSYFKQLGNPVPCTTIGKVVEVDGRGKRVEAVIDGYVVWFKFLYAFETFFKLKEGDSVVIVYPEFQPFDERYCAIENKLA